MTTDLNQTALCARFRELTDENWRNSFYIECAACRYEKEKNCGDFLFVPDEAGRPLLFPLSLARAELSCIDWSECLGHMSNLMFLELYKHCLSSHIMQEGSCPFLEYSQRVLSRLSEEADDPGRFDFGTMHK